MNRIILIGNGFDVAHKLKTLYKDFIEWFWIEQTNKINNETKFQEWFPVSGQGIKDHYIHRNNRFFDVKFYETDKKLLRECCKQEETKHDVKNKNETSLKQIDIDNFQEENESKPFSFKLKYETQDKLKKKVVYKNKFLELIEQRKQLKNWVDIEELYFEILTNCKDRLKLSESVYEIYTVEQLNDDFRCIKEELKQFVLRRNKVLTEDTDFTTRLKNDIVKKINEKINTYPNVEKKPIETILFLNFNYTETVSTLYNIDNKKRQMFQIHGRAESAEEEMIVGYGDEKSDHSPDIENLNDNSFLENVKSIKYVEAEHYAKLLRFIEKDYDVFVFGHSCGNSDRTLLKKLFENEHCKEIRCFYYKNEDGYDDFTTTIDNIYRKFDDKNSFRLSIRKRNKEEDAFPQFEGNIPTKLIPEIIKPKVELLSSDTSGSKESHTIQTDALGSKESHTIQTIQSDIKKDYVLVDVGKNFKYTLLENGKEQIISGSYYISKYQVTQKQWYDIMKDNPSWFQKNRGGKKSVENMNTDHFPVENVSWYDCVLFCNKLSEEHGLTKYYNINGKDVTFNVGAKGFRLPTEAEWEYAARHCRKDGVKATKYAGTDDRKELKNYAWYYENSGDKELDEAKWSADLASKNNCRTHTVGSAKKADELKIHDMSGNVWEWCEDWYDTAGANRVLRGGSWYNFAEYCTVSYRYYITPDYRYYGVGFRLVLPR